jgi:hypothetical protein
MKKKLKKYSILVKEDRAYNYNYISTSYWLKAPWLIITFPSVIC